MYELRRRTIRTNSLIKISVDKITLAHLNDRWKTHVNCTKRTVKLRENPLDRYYQLPLKYQRYLLYPYTQILTISSYWLNMFIQQAANESKQNLVNMHKIIILHISTFVINDRTTSNLIYAK